MSWTTPKTNWAVADAVPYTELNKIGENLAYLKTFFTMSGNIGGPDATVTLGAGGTCFQELYVDLPIGMSLCLHRARYKVGTGGATIKVIPASGGTEWESAGYAGDEEPDLVLYSNGTGAPITTIVSLYIVSPGGGSFGRESGWTLDLQILPT